MLRRFSNSRKQHCRASGQRAASLQTYVASAMINLFSAQYSQSCKMPAAHWICKASALHSPLLLHTDNHQETSTFAQNFCKNAGITLSVTASTPATTSTESPSTVPSGTQTISITDRQPSMTTSITTASTAAASSTGASNNPSTGGAGTRIIHFSWTRALLGVAGYPILHILF